MKKRERLGDILKRMGVIDELQLNAALAHHRQWGTPIGRCFIEKRLCSAADVLAALSQQSGLPLIDLDIEPLDLSLVPLITQKVAEQHKVVPLRLEGAKQEALVVAIAAPASLASLDAIRSVSRKQRIVPYLALDEAIERAYGKLYLGYAGTEPARVASRPSLTEREIVLDALPELSVAEVTTEAPGPSDEVQDVWVYGWSPETHQALLKLFASEGITARVAQIRDVVGVGPNEVVVAPLPAIEEVIPMGQKFRGQLVVAVKSPERDLPRAQALGARGYVATPVDKDLLIRAIRRCLRGTASSATATQPSP